MVHPSHIPARNVRQNKTQRPFYAKTAHATLKYMNLMCLIEIHEFKLKLHESANICFEHESGNQQHCTNN